MFQLIKIMLWTLVFEWNKTLCAVAREDNNNAASLRSKGRSLSIFGLEEHGAVLTALMKNFFQRHLHQLHTLSKAAICTQINFYPGFIIFWSPFLWIIIFQTSVGF